LRFARRFAAGYFDSYRGLPATTWILCLAAFVNRAGAMVVPFLSIWLGQRYGYSVAEAGRLISLYGIGGILGSLAGGRLTDAFGPVRVQIVSLLGTGAWMLFMTTIEQQWVLAGSVLVLGLLNDAFRPGNQTAVGASCDAAVRPKALAMNRLALNAGWMIGPSVGGFLAKASYTWLFLVDGATCVVAAVILWACLRGWRPEIHKRPEGDMSRTWHDGLFLSVLISSFFALLAFLQYFSTEPRYLKDALDNDEITIGLLLAINPLIIVLFEVPIAGRLRGRHALSFSAIGCFVSGVAFLVLIPEFGMLGVITSLAVLTLGEIFEVPVLSAWVYERAPAHARGAYTGMFTGTFSLGFVLAPWLGGELYDYAGADALWWACGGLGTLGAIGLLAARARERRQLGGR
jgi:predicted MFS family arabinose efflux permease